MTNHHGWVKMVVWMPTDLKDSLDSYSDKTGLSKSSIVRKAINDFLYGSVVVEK